MDMTQIVLAIVGSIAVWALKSVIDLQKQQTELKGELSATRNEAKAEIAAARNAHDSERAHLNYRLDELKAGMSELKAIISSLVSDAKKNE